MNEIYDKVHCCDTDFTSITFSLRHLSVIRSKNARCAGPLVNNSVRLYIRPKWRHSSRIKSLIVLVFQEINILILKQF